LNVVRDRETAPTLAAVSFRVAQRDRGPGRVCLETLDAAGKLEVVASSSLGRDPGFAGEGTAGIDDVEGLGRGVGDGAAAVGGRKVEAIGDGTTPVVIAVEGADGRAFLPG